MRKSDRGRSIGERTRNSARRSFAAPRARPPRFHLPPSLVIHLDGSQTRGQAQLHPWQKAARAASSYDVRGPRPVGEERRAEMRRDEAQVLRRGQRRAFAVVSSRTGGTNPFGSCPPSVERGTAIIRGAPLSSATCKRCRLTTTSDACPDRNARMSGRRGRNARSTLIVPGVGEKRSFGVAYRERKYCECKQERPDGTRVTSLGLFGAYDFLFFFLER